MQGGVGAFSRIIAQTFAGMRHDVFVLTSVAGSEEFPGVHLSSTIKTWRLGSLWQVKEWARDNRLDVINLQFQTAAFGMSPWIHFLPQMVDVPVVTTFHDLRFPYLFPKAGRLRDWIVLHLARRSAGVIVTNHEDLARICKLPHNTLIPIGSNILTDLPAKYDRSQWRKQAGANDDDFLLAFFGFVNHSKGLDVLLESMATLRDDGLPIKLALIGGRTGTSDPTNIDYANTIDGHIQQLGLTDSIYSTGYVDDEAVTSYLHAADAVVLPFRDGASYRRGTLMAAIQHECPIITTTSPAEIPTFKHGENLYLIPPDDSQALADAIHTLHDSPDLRDNLQQGAATLKQQFDWGQIAQDSLTFFRTVTGLNS